ncbi:hypothetical protein ACQ5ES_09555 [Pseudidiomarina sp. E22-M8]|uniref:hypothetical protein n=1 Tax=Pseudidiomarina sp. E22-M8 TaxID=3424768 RepID=UPI00403D2E8A
MPTLLRYSTTILLIGYPFLVWWLAQQGYMRELFVALAVILLLQAISLGFNNPRSYLALVALAMVLLVAWFTDPLTGVLYYPVWMNACLLVLFCFSLLRPPAVITRLATLMEGSLSPAAVRYTERVTLVWAIFFALNGSIAWWTVYLGDMQLWALYNGLIAYLLMGLLMAVEWSIRRVVKKRH